MSQLFRRSVVVLVSLVAVLAACGGGDDTSSADAAGSITISGSSTVEPISAGNAEKYSAENPDIAISVAGPGTGDGFAQFCAGETDISDASRPIKESEVEQCAANGIDWIELQVAVDGLSVITSRQNDAFTCLDTADLYALLGDESIGFDTWADANDLAAEIGAPNAPYPDAPLVVTAPGEESGTFDSFVEFLVDGVAGGEDYAETRGVENVRPDYVASPNDNVIIEGISSTATSLGWVGYAFYLTNADTVKALDLSVGGGECVSPSPETIADGSYAFSRPLFIYVSAASADRPEVAGFVDFYLSDEALETIDETGYVRNADYETVRRVWESRTVGRSFSE